MSLRETLSRQARRVLSNVVHRGWDWVSDTGTITPESAAGRRFARLGKGSYLRFPPGTIFGERWIEIADLTVIGPDVTLSTGWPGKDLGVEPIIRIGSGCLIGRGSHIVGHHSIEIGDNVWTGPNVYITDQNHGYEDPHTPIGHQWPCNDAVVIGSGSWLGAGVIVLPGSHLGRNVVVAAGTVVRGKFPDHCVLAGVPATIVREYVPGTGWRRPVDGPVADLYPPPPATAPPPDVS